MKIPYDRLDDIKRDLLDPDMRAVGDFLAVVDKYGTPEEINLKAERARQLHRCSRRWKKLIRITRRNLQWLQDRRMMHRSSLCRNIVRKYWAIRHSTIKFADEFAVDPGNQCTAIFPMVDRGGGKGDREKSLCQGDT